MSNRVPDNGSVNNVRYAFVMPYTTILLIVCCAVFYYRVGEFESGSGGLLALLADHGGKTEYTIKSRRILSDKEQNSAVQSLRIRRKTARRKHPEFRVRYRFVEITLPGEW